MVSATGDTARPADAAEFGGTTSTGMGNARGGGAALCGNTPQHQQTAGRSSRPPADAAEFGGTTSPSTGMGNARGGGAAPYNTLRHQQTADRSSRPMQAEHEARKPPARGAVRVKPSRGESR